MPRKSANKKPLLLGESPSKSGDRYHMFPLSGRVAQTLCELSGIPPQEEGTRYGRWTWALYDHFECENVFERYAQADPWSHVQAVHSMNVVLGDARVVVCLGRKVQRAVLAYFDGHLAFGGDDFYDWNIAEADDGYLIDFVAIPHPSGLNRLLNDPEQRGLCGQTLREAMRKLAT